MEFFKKITDFIQDLEEKDFYKYIIILLVSLFIIISFMVYSYYSKINEYTQEIDRINEIRSGKVKNILTRLKIVQTQQKEADDTLKKEPDFKIKYYFDNLLRKLNLSEYIKEESDVIAKPADEKHVSDEFEVKLGGIDMAQLCGLLKELQEKRRIKINLLEITKSQKKDAIDVNLTISTLLLETQTTI